MAPKRKLIFLELNIGKSKIDYEIDIDCNNEKTDLESVIEVIKRKKPALSEYHRDDFIFQKESSTRKGKWISVGDISPLKPDSDLKCVVDGIFFYVVIPAITTSNKIVVSRIIIDVISASK